MPKDQSGFTPLNILVIIIVIIVVGIGAYFIGSKNTPQQAPQPAGIPNPSPGSTISPSPTPVPSQSATPALPSPSPSAAPNPTISPALLENIKASVVSKNTAALEGYMTDTVSVILEATECCGNLTKVEAIKQMDYLIPATEPWNFDDNNPVAVALRKKSPLTFPEGSIIGSSANKMLVTFTLNPEKTKIIKVYMAVDYKLLGI